MSNSQTKIFPAYFLAVLLLAFGAVHAASAQQRQNVSGTLAPTVEAGGWLIVAQAEKYLLLNAEKFSGENWFRAGTKVSATGTIRRGAITIYQEGVPYEAQTLRPSGGSNNSNAGSGETSANRLTTVTVSGTARAAAQPDTAIVSVSVVTQAASAIEAQQRNAAQTTSVVDALKRVAGANAEIKTSDYALLPQRVYRENQPPTINGYEARNTVAVTLGNLGRVGAIIDAAARAGANNINSVAFTLRQDASVRRRALADAARAAIGKADALAAALGGRVVRIVAVEEAGIAAPRPLAYDQPTALAAQVADTPIVVGALDINAEVRLVAEVEIGANPR